MNSNLLNLESESSNTHPSTSGVGVWLSFRVHSTPLLNGSPATDYTSVELPFILLMDEQTTQAVDQRWTVNEYDSQPVAPHRTGGPG